jgi:hypothetical protein
MHSGIRWAWVPAAMLVAAGSWVRFGPLVTVVLIVIGLCLAGAIRWRAERDRG